MKLSRALCACCSAVALFTLGAPIRASETTTYSYDALGRLVRTSIGGGPSDGISTALCFDAAGNRARYYRGSGSGPACAAPTYTPLPDPTPTPAPTPTPTPTPANSPPIANADAASFNCSITRTVDLTANDTDPEGNLPLNLISVTGNEDSVWIVSMTSSSVTVATNSAGQYYMDYTVADSLGATSQGSLSLAVTGTQCRQGPPI